MDRWRRLGDRLADVILKDDLFHHAPLVAHRPLLGAVQRKGHFPRARVDKVQRRLPAVERDVVRQGDVEVRAPIRGDGHRDWHRVRQRPLHRHGYLPPVAAGDPRHALAGVVAARGCEPPITAGVAHSLPARVEGEAVEQLLHGLHKGWVVQAILSGARLKLVCRDVFDPRAEKLRGVVPGAVVERVIVHMAALREDRPLIRAAPEEMALVASETEFAAIHRLVLGMVDAEPIAVLDQIGGPSLEEDVVPQGEILRRPAPWVAAVGPPAAAANRVKSGPT
mmetsp:Transcript_54640/g.166043  ORF Transcript_54640/g.166043 Transcript_54640/m.166043 type:complete len:280 (+) Transcript_54640:3233-4072(+)